MSIKNPLLDTLGFDYHRESEAPVSELNKHGLSRTIPEPAARLFRQRCGFGCGVNCSVSLIASNDVFLPKTAKSYNDGLAQGQTD